METKEQKLIQFFQEHKEDMIEDLLTLVRAESPTADKAAVDKCGQELQKLYRDRLNAVSEVFPCEVTGDHLCTCFGEGERKILLPGHFDTVHPIGSVPVRREGDILYGPGVIDMKGGLICVIWSLMALKKFGFMEERQFILVNNSDEERGSRTSRDLIIEKAKECVCCVVAEPAEVKTGHLKTSRKGLGSIKVTCTGKEAHSGNNPQDGINANLELAHQILYLSSLTDFEKGTTLCPNIINGGREKNVVSASAEAFVDFRMCTLEEMDRIQSVLEAREAQLPGAKVAFDFYLARPPFAQSEQERNMYAVALQAAEAVGMTIGHVDLAGGGSDGNLTSAAGIPTIDGMGVVGDLLHNPGEHLYLDQLVPRTALLASLLMRL